MPIGAASVSEAIRMCAEVYDELKKILKSKEDDWDSSHLFNSEYKISGLK